MSWYFIFLFCSEKEKVSVVAYYLQHVNVCRLRGERHGSLDIDTVWRNHSESCGLEMLECNFQQTFINPVCSRSCNVRTPHRKENLIRMLLTPGWNTWSVKCPVLGDLPLFIIQSAGSFTSLTDVSILFSFHERWEIFITIQHCFLLLWTLSLWAEIDEGMETAFVQGLRWNRKPVNSVLIFGSLSCEPRVFGSLSPGLDFRP